MALLAAILLVAVAYAIGIERIRRRARGSDLCSTQRIGSMGIGLLLLGTALASPLDELAEQLLSAHMTQHLLLMIAAAPLLVWARPIPALIWCLPPAARHAVGRIVAVAARSRVGRTLERPLVGGIVFCGTLAFWHLPAVYRWMQGSELRHIVMHLTFFGSAVLFWSIALDPAEGHRNERAGRILLVLSTALITGLPGALMSFARQPIYATASVSPLPFDLTVLQDQQLAGLLMWIPMDLVLFCVAAGLLRGWLFRSTT